MNNKKLLVFNTAVLTASGFIMRTVAVAFNVYLTGKIGADGIGLFQLIMNVYSLAVTFACGGIKLGATRLVTHALCTKSESEKRTVSLCLRYSLFTGGSISLLLFTLSAFIANKWITDIRAINSLKILSLNLPAVAVSAALNGYFTAKKSMLKYSCIQLTEQIFKIGVTVAALQVAAGRGLSAMCSAVCAGISLSEIFSAFLSSVAYLTARSKKADESKTHLFGSLIRVSLPDMLGAGMRSVLLTIEHLLIPAGFKKSGQSQSEALSIYGKVHAMALPLILYPATVLTSLSSMLVPELSEKLSMGQSKRINYAANKTLKLTVVFSLGTAVFMFMFSQTVALAVYNDSTVSFYIQLLSFLLPVMYMDTVTDGLLKGLDQQVYSMKYNIFDSALCVILVYILLPAYAIKGYIFILFLSEIINFSLSINRLSKVTTLKFNIGADIISPLICACFCGLIINLFSAPLGFINSSKAILIISCCAYSLLYIFCLGILSEFNKANNKKSAFPRSIALD